MTFISPTSLLSYQSLTFWTQICHLMDIPIITITLEEAYLYPSCIPFIISCLWLCGYPMLYAFCLAFCSVVGSCSSSQLACPVVFSLKELCLSEDLGFCSLFYPVHICTALWDILSGIVHSGIGCLASWAPDWTVAFWNGLSGLWLVALW